MITCNCPHCSWTDTVGQEFSGQTVECPSCGNDFDIAQQQHRDKSNKGKKNSRNKPSVNRTNRKEKPVKLGTAKALIAFQACMCLLIFGGLGVFFFTTETQYEQQAKVNPIFGAACIIIGAILSSFFLFLLKSLTNKKKWAYKISCGLSLCYIFSPFFIWGFLSLKQLGQDSVSESFGISE